MQHFRVGLAERKIQIATAENTRSPIVSFYIRKRYAEAAKILEADRVKVSPQEVAPPDPAAGLSLPTRVRVAIAFFNNEADVERMLDVASKLSAS